jgi:hypothetical protein
MAITAQSRDMAKSIEGGERALHILLWGFGTQAGLYILNWYKVQRKYDGYMNFTPSNKQIL